MKKLTTKTFLAALMGVGMSQGILQAQNEFYEPGDLVLFIQKPGANNSVHVSLGNAANLYRGSAAGPQAALQATNIININSELTTAFGAGWASDTGVYAGLIAARSSSVGTQVIDGDQTRTLYASRSRAGVGTPGTPESATWDFTLSGASTAGAQSAIGFNNIFDVNFTTQAAVAPMSVSKVDIFNPFLDASLGIQDTAFNAFPGGVQQRGSASTYGAFGPVGSPEFMLDLYRIVPRNDSDTTGEVSGVQRIGSYEGTVTIDSSGNVSFITQAGDVPPPVDTTYEPGDLVLYFQKPGANDSVHVTLGSAANLYRGSAAGPQAALQATNIININSELTTAFGAGWASDTGVYAGLIAARSSSVGTQVIDGDQTRTLYASRSRAGVGAPGTPESAPWDFTLSGASTAGAQSAIGFNNIFDVNFNTQAAVAPVSVSKVDTFNPFLDVSLGIQSTAFSAFPGGVQQRGSANTYGAFGPVGSPEFMLDLYRIVPRNDSDTTGEVSGVQRIGSYEGTVTIDSAGNVSFITQAGDVPPPVDTTPPVITLIGANPINLMVGDPFTDPGANVTDNVDAPRTITGSGMVNTAVAGTYTLTYATSDAAGNAAVPVTRTVMVNAPPVDTVAPVITLIGANPINLVVGDSFTDPGATVTDNVDATRTISGTGTVNTSLAGTYTLTYSTSDAAGNAAVPVTRSVIVTAAVDTVAPVITLIGANPINLVVGDSFTDPGATVTDNVDASRTITGTGIVDTAVAGTYTLTYATSDAAGNAAAPVTRTVIVTAPVDTVAPVITLIGANPISLVVGGSFTDPGATVTDNVDAPRTINGTGIVDTAVAGTYTLTYATSDAAGNAATPVTRTVIVTDAVDTVAPVITLIGANPISLVVGGSFTDPGATVTDNVDAPRTISGSGTVNTAVVGTYTLTYSASDAAGNAATPVTRTVIVNSATDIPASTEFVTAGRDQLDISNFFNEGPFTNANVEVIGRLPNGLRYDPAAKILSGYPRRVPAEANFTVTLPGQPSQTFVMVFSIRDLTTEVIGTHVAQTAAGDELTIRVSQNGSATVSINKPGERRSTRARANVSYDADASDPSLAWTIVVPSENIAIAFPVIRTLNVAEGSFLGNYGQFEGKALWGFKTTDSLGEIILRRGQTEIAITGQIRAGGSVIWSITPTGGRTTRARGACSADGICSIAADVRDVGPITGMLRVDEQLDEDGTPTGEFVVTILQGFQDWTPVQYTAP